MQENLILKYLEAFSAGSANDNTHIELWIKGAGMVIDQFNQLLDILGQDHVHSTPMSAFSNEHETDLGCLLTRHRSDKEMHRYHLLYAHIFQQVGRQEEIHLLEVGIGTNNPTKVSTMGSTGRPGASLYAWSEYLPNAHIYGADIDVDILFQDPSLRIRTAFVDQLDRSSMDALPGLLEQNAFDVIIDDGLHSFAANMNTLLMGLRYIKHGGWIVIEDIKNERLNSWRIVQTMFKMSGKYETFLIEAAMAFVFVVHNI